MLKIDPTGNSAMASFESNYKESPVLMLPAGGSSSLYLFCFALQSTVAVSFWPAYGKTYPILLLLRLRPIFRALFVFKKSRSSQQRNPRLVAVGMPQHRRNLGGQVSAEAK
jgi:hypothetical protein